MIIWCIETGKQEGFKKKVPGMRTHLVCPHHHQRLHLFRYKHCKHESQTRFVAFTSTQDNSSLARGLTVICPEHNTRIKAVLLMQHSNTKLESTG